MAHRNPRNRQRPQQRATSPLTQDPQDVMSTAMRLQWNIRVLQRHDPKITDIVDQFTYAVLYRFEEDQWVKKGVEGSMFIYTRTDPPRHGMCILNREGAGNYVQPMRRGDDMEVTENYIIYRPVDVPRDRFEDYLGIWTADLGERARLGEGLTKIKNHIAKTDVPYTPVLLHMPATDPAPPPMTLQMGLQNAETVTDPASRQKNRRASSATKNPQGTPSSTPLPANAKPATNETSGQTIESLFSRLALPTDGSGVAQTPGANNKNDVASLATSPSRTEELRGQNLLQSIFASAAQPTQSDSNDSTSPQATVVPLAASANLVDQLFSSLQTAQVQQPSPVRAAVYPFATPFVEDDDSPYTSPQGKRITQATRQEPTPSTPPSRNQRPAHSNRQPSVSGSVIDSKKTPTGNENGTPSNGKGRTLVPEDTIEAQVVSPWANKSLQDVHPPSPSQLPRPKAVRERKSRQHRPSQSTSSQSQYVPQNDQPAQSSKLDKRAAAAATAFAVNGNSGSGLSKQDFAQELLKLIHQNGDFVDLAYKEYIARRS